MGTWRLGIAGVVVLAALWWLYPRPGAEHPTDVTEVTIWFNGPIEDRHIDVIDAFEREFTEYRGLLGSSAVQTGLEGEGNPQRLMCGVAGGVPPEVVEYDRFAICQWAARGAFLDLNEFIQKDLRRLDEDEHRLEALKQQGAAPAEIEKQEVLVARMKEYAIRPEDYYPATWDECTYQGRQYGIPNYMDTRVLYYNSDLLIQAEFVDADGHPRPPDTWEQIITKRVQVEDATVDGSVIRSAAADFVAAGVCEGDTVSHISTDGGVTRCLVERVVGPHELTVRSAYPSKKLKLPSGAGEHVKVFDQDSYAIKLSHWDDEGRMKVVGFEPQHGNGWLFHYGWLNGGEFMSADGRSCTLDDPRIAEALQFTTDVYDAMGGLSAVNAFKKSFQAYAQDPFFQNQIALFIHGDWFLRDLARYARDMRFGTYPPPVPQRQLEAGQRYGTWIGGFAWCVPSTCPPDKRDAAWALVKFLSSAAKGGKVMNEHDAQRERAQGRLYIPRLMANKKLTRMQLEAYVDIAEMPERVRQAVHSHIDLLPYARYRPVSPAGLKLWNGQADAQDLAWNHHYTPAGALKVQTAKVQQELDRFLSPPAGPKMHWKYLVWGYLVLLIGTAGWVYWRYQRWHPAGGIYRREWYTGLAFAAPWMLGFIVLSGGPMVFSLMMSTTDYDVINPATFVAADNYREMLTTDWANVGGVRQALGNTLFMGIGLPIGMAVGLGLAMLLNLNVKAISVYRTTFFLPAIMPVVAASVLWIWVFNAQNGLLNWLLHLSGLESLLDYLGVRTPISWLTDKTYSKPALIIMGLWGAGAGMIIWLAGLKEIPKYLYEAAALDGAGPIRRFFLVTLPMLSPYILFNLIMGLIGTFQIFTQAYIMTRNGSPERSTYFYVYKLFDECFSFFRLGYGAAMAWVLFVIVILLTLVNMIFSKKWVHYAGE
ncbi:MAG: extracellular solute-binding protein [Planctomycetota bacterium]